MKGPRISKRAKAKAGAVYLGLRGAYAKNYLAARYNQAIDRHLGEGNYDAEIFFRNKVRNARAPLKEYRREINKEIKRVEADLYLLRIAEKQEASPEKKKRISSAIARTQNLLNILNDTKYVLSAKRLALGSRETRKRLRSYRKFKKRKIRH